MTNFYELFWQKINTHSFELSNIEEALNFRLCALRNVTHSDEAIRSTAIDFLRRTSKNPEKAIEDASNWAECGSPQIRSKKTSQDLNAIVYKVQRAFKGDEAHEIAFFSYENGTFIFEHKEDLNEQYQRYCAKETVDYKIRQIGDPVLHQAAREVLHFDGSEGDELKSQLAILKKNLYVTGGVGIAANQCSEIENPFKIILSGVNYDNPEHVVKALTRYQTVLFPRMKVLINPVVLKLDDELSEFSEGCLSVCGAIRGEVKRPKSVMVKYQDMDGAYHEETFEGTDARVMLHELDHILHGFVYMQRLIAELTAEQCHQLVGLLKQVIETERGDIIPSLFLMPTNVFNRNKEGELFFNEEEVKAAFAKMANETLLGVLGKLEDKLNQINHQRKHSRN